MKFLLVIMFLICSGCATVAHNGPETKISVIDRPGLGETATANIGDQLIQKGEVVEEQVLRINKMIDGFAYDIPEGTYRQIGHDDENDYYSSVGVIAGPLIDPHKALKLGKARGSDLCVITVFNWAECYKGDYERKTQISERGTSFQQTLIYSGRVGDKIKVGYREFSNNVARPAFNNDVEYDMSTSNIIGYKGAEIAIIKADNTSLTYKVLKTFR